MICNPALKNVLTYLGSADLQSAAKEYAFPFIGGLQIPRCYRSNLFLRRISNPPGRLAGLRLWKRLAECECASPMAVRPNPFKFRA